MLTAASCVDDLRPWSDNKVIGVGFGDAKTGPVYGVVGTSAEWINPRFLPNPDGADLRAGVAVVELADPVADIAPLPLATRPLSLPAAGTALGYGRITAGASDADYLGALLDAPALYPGTRKSIPVDIGRYLGTIDAYARGSDGLCYGDFGGPLLNARAEIAGVLSHFPRDVVDADIFDGRPMCSPGNGGAFANVLFATNPQFIRDRVAAIGGGQ